jgi:hypothetical protein
MEIEVRKNGAFCLAATPDGVPAQSHTLGFVQAEAETASCNDDRQTVRDDVSGRPPVC